MNMFFLFSLTTMILLQSCAQLHHVQIGDMDLRSNNWKPFDIKVNENGFNLEEAGRIAQAISQSEAGKSAAGDIVAIISLFQQGPRTGNPTFNDKYARDVIKKLQEVCPSGRMTAVTSIREMRKYPVISGEIVKITGLCLVKES
jgi:hypothetical protein